MSNLVQQSEILSRFEELNDSKTQAQLQSDAELLALYLDGGNREAIERLIRRYAPMVASVCRLTVSDEASAEDAFQATFLILLRSATKIRKQSSVAAWLHGVAYRTASRIRKKGRQQAASGGHDEVIKLCETTDDPIAQLARKMELEALDRELEGLPERLRGPLVEHYLLGYSAPEIAQRMDLSTSAVEGRLRRGRRQLRTRLAKRGISLSVLLAGSSLFQEHLIASDAADWTENFIEQQFPDPSIGGSGSDTVNTSSPNPEVSSLVNGEITMLSTTTLKTSLTVGLMLVAGAFAVIAADKTDLGSAGNSANRVPDVTLSGVNPDPQVLAQFGGSQPAGGKTGARGGQAGVPAASPAGGQGQNSGFDAVAAGGVPAGISGVTGLGGTLTTNAQANKENITWQPPEATQAAEPNWLNSGGRSMQALEANREVLTQDIEFEFGGVPLNLVAEWLTEQTGVQFELDVPELDLLGVDPDEPVSVKGRGPVRELLRRVLPPLELTYRVTESTIEITSLDAADAEPTIRFYDLSFVLPNASNSDAVVQAIEQTADPACWSVNGGNSTIVMVGSTLIVGARETTHQTIEVILLNLTKMNRKNLEKANPNATSMMGGFGGGFGGGGFGGGVGGLGGGVAGGGGGMF